MTCLGSATVDVWIPESIGIFLNDPWVTYHSGEFLAVMVAVHSDVGKSRREKVAGGK